jgi:hypothetical protein
MLAYTFTSPSGRITTYERDIIKYVLKRGYYISLAFTYQPSPTQSGTENEGFNHMVTVVDYEDKRRKGGDFIITLKNSWGRSFSIESDVYKAREEGGIIKVRDPGFQKAYLFIMLPDTVNIISELFLKNPGMIEHVDLKPCGGDEPICARYGQFAHCLPTLSDTGTTEERCKVRMPRSNRPSGSSATKKRPRTRSNSSTTKRAHEKKSSSPSEY